MEWIGLAVLVAVGLLGAWQTWRRIARILHAPRADYEAIRDQLRRIQLAACENAFDQRPETSDRHEEASESELSSADVERQAAIVGEAVRLVYAVDREEDGYLHVISALLLDRKRDDDRFQVLLVVTNLLAQQLENAGIDYRDTKWDVDLTESAPGWFRRRSSPQARSFSLRLDARRHAALIAAEMTIPSHVGAK